MNDQLRDRARITKWFELQRIPDRNRLSHQMTAGGNVFTAAAEDNERFLNMVAIGKMKDVSFTLRFFVHRNDRRSLQDGHLSVYVIVSAPTQRAMRSASAVIDSGPLCRFYALVPVRPRRIAWRRLGHAQYVTRTPLAVNPSVKKEVNRNVPEQKYFGVLPLVPRNNNDYLDLDRVAAAINEFAVVDIAVCPADICHERIACSRLLDAYRAVNRVWDDADLDGGPPRDYLGEEVQSLHLDWHARTRLKPRTDPIADEMVDNLRTTERTLTSRHILFNIRVLTETAETGELLAATVAESAFLQGQYAITSYSHGDSFFLETVVGAQQCTVLSVSVHTGVFEGKDLERYAGLERLSSLAPVSELASAFRLPIASFALTYCLVRDTDPPPLTGNDAWRLGYGPAYLVNGEIDEVRSILRGQYMATAATHALLTGATGSGKSTCGASLIVQLWRAGIPVLVFEYAKSGFRSLKLLRESADPCIRDFAKALQVYTVGVPDVAPFHINLCEIPPGMSRDEAIAKMVRQFQSSLALHAPLPELLSEALEIVYYEKEDISPTIDDVYHIVLQVLADKHYSGETLSDLHGALSSRLGTLTRGHLGRVFLSPRTCPSIASLMNSWTVLEMDRLSVEHAALITMSILDHVTARIKSTPWNDPNPRLAIIIEEGHVVIGENADARVSDTNADTKSYSTDTISRIAAEFRSYGVALFIINQLASVLSPKVLRIPGTHVAFKQVDALERDTIANVMGLNPMQKEELMRLSVGECFFTTAGYYEPIRISTTDLFRRLLP